MSFILANKPFGVSSFGFINSLKKRLGLSKIGHSGTLDPFATGLMLIAVDEATKFLRYLPSSKTYQVKLAFGKTSKSMDIDCDEFLYSDERPTIPEILKIMPKFLGRIEQTPNKFSAVKIQGRAAYSLARKGIDFEMPQRTVEIYQIKFFHSKIEYVADSDSVEKIELEVKCAAGTYIRTLVHDIAKELGCIAIVESLKRTAIGDFVLENDEIKNISLDVLKNYYENLVISESDYDKLRNGCVIDYPGHSGVFAAVNLNVQFVGMVRIDDGRLSGVRLMRQYAHKSLISQ
jgi:tRNA pseudouridine55 synthase